METTDELRDLLDRQRVDDHAEQAEWARAEAQMLQHLAHAPAHHGDDYPALRAGLADYARGIQKRLDTCPYRD